MAKPKGPIEYTLDPSQWLEWTYPRPNGDLSVFAPTRDDAVRTLAEHGVTAVDPSKLTCSDKLLADVLQKAPIE